jgi:hypothetical protein
MKTPTLKSSILFVAALLALVISTSACSFPGIMVSPGTVYVNGVRVSSEPVHVDDVRVSVSPSTVYVDVTLLQDEFNQGSLIGDHHMGHPCVHLLDRFNRIEIHEGFLRYFGTKHQPDLSEVEGSFDLALAAQDGTLDARIIAVDIPGIDLDDHIVLEVNRELADELTHMVYDSHGVVYFDEVVLREGEMNLKLHVSTYVEFH